MQTTALDAAACRTEAHEMATECVHYLVKELVRGDLARAIELKWRALEHRVEEHLLWQAASIASIVPVALYFLHAQATARKHCIVLQELDLLGAKLYLVEHGHCDSMVLSTMAGDEVVALLVDAVYKSSFAPHMTYHERRRQEILPLEIVLTLSRKQSSETFTHVTRSLTRYAVEAAVSTSRTPAACTLLWEFLELFLTHAAS
ncbi:hypothetical protein PsorP6_009942 [Peronosclerospora sorghi]|uniref:Uncharacterized protein n=1 Tax=Peronosclerospora sorghi TaxID=230839 RepID=A0ACC0VXC0_9STRA|nr:hypothetical protein PsorP6_009942 [Peronosclerospora sorghi]